MKDSLKHQLTIFEILPSHPRFEQLPAIRVRPLLMTISLALAIWQ